MSLYTQSCPIFWDLVDCSPPGSSLHRISKARILEWVAISSSRGSSRPRDQTSISCIGKWILYHWATREAQKHTQGLYNNKSFKWTLFSSTSVTQSCLTLCNPMDCSTPGLPVHHQLPELTQTHVHWVGDAIQPSVPGALYLNHPSPPHLPPVSFPREKNLPESPRVNLQFSVRFKWCQGTAVDLGPWGSHLAHTALDSAPEADCRPPCLTDARGDKILHLPTRTTPYTG